MSKSNNNKNDLIIIPFIIVGIVIAGAIGLYMLEKMSYSDQRICKYLGGLWERKATDSFHHCYTYQEFYR